MRLHRLRICAFGPFADEVVVDFDALGADGLFLLHGQTGAGKTTVLDAVAFALFGRVPGARDINRRLHSDHAAPEVVPEVELEATIGARRLRIIRSPEHERPKKRGEGTRKINAKATLAWVDGSGPDLTRIPDIGDAVVRLLGMSAEQFFQVVLLPQGDFAKFLRAHSDEREALLERLFDTERFGDLEEWFRGRARESADRLAEHTGAIERLASAIGAVSATPPPSEPDIEWAQTCLDAARADLSRATTDLSAAQTRAQESQTAYEQARRLAELRRRGEVASARLAELAAGQPALDQADRARQMALRAGSIVPFADEHARVTGEVQVAEQAADRARSRLAALPEGAALCEGNADDKALEAAIARWTEESGRWEPLAVRLSGRPAMVSALQDLERTVTDTDRRIREAREQLASAPERRSAAVAELRAAEDAAATIPVLRAARDEVRRVRRALSERAEVEKAVRSATADLLDAREKHTAAREHLLDIRERRVAGMAVELAARLVDGEACVVCGATDHPAPAVAETQQPPSEAEEKAAAAAEEEASTAREHARSAMAAIEARRADLDTVIADADPAAVAADDARLGEALATAERAANRLSSLRQALDALDAEVAARRAAVGDLESAQAGRRERLSSARAELAALDAEVEQATGGRVGLAERRRELAELCRRTRELAAARGDLRRSRDRLAEVTERLQTACAAGGFDSVDAVRTAAASDRQIRAWETMLAEAANLRAAAQDTLDDAEVRAALDAAAPDVDALEEQCRVASDLRETAAGVHAVARQRVGDLEDLLGQYWAALDTLRPVQERHAELFGLAELVSGRGQNSRRMTLRSYVLAARLDEVLVAASARLRQMSSGRYEFVHSDAVGPRGRRGGLGIEVRDEYTGALRPTTTLSGGETFFASLALALGLADVVSAESGGRVLDTIFIDEGFGTLDPEALDLVMGVLDELREGGRVVGVVSHVDELRARIPAQLHVLRGENGSRIRLQSPLGVS